MNERRERALRQFAAAAWKLSDRAAALELTLGNGGDVSSLISAIAQEIELQAEHAQQKAGA